ncbi:unnamed protein product, partial [marine sediment metagenome]
MNTGSGIRLEQSTDNDIRDNSCTASYAGVLCFRNSTGNSIHDNTFSSNLYGIALSFGSDNNTICNNEVSSNNCAGISLWQSDSNAIYLNNLIDNSPNAGSEESINNTWNSPEEMTYTYHGNTYTNYLGNYWNDYAAYLLPVGHNNPGTIYLITGDTYYWQDEALAYDGNIETYAKVWVGDIQFGPWLELFAPPKPSQGIRFWLGPWINYGIHPTVELFYDGDWHFLTEWKDGQWRVLDEYREGNIPPKGEWIEIDYPEQMIEKARIRYGPDTLGSRGYAQLHEFQFKTASSDADGDGIWDTPYTIDGDKDNYPLMEPFENYEMSEDTTPPTVSSVSPEDSATDVRVDTVVTATFSEAMDSTTITTDSFTLAGSAVSGTVTYNPATYTATFTPDTNLDYNHTYTATLSTAITDLAGNSLDGGEDGTSEGSPIDDYSWSFAVRLCGMHAEELHMTPTIWSSFRGFPFVLAIYANVR